MPEQTPPIDRQSEDSLFSEMLGDLDPPVSDELVSTAAADTEPARPWYRVRHRTVIAYLLAVAAVLGPVATMVASCQ
ncbi:hypothetical protein [Paractinoplanes maris]|uniref:hypothetical protein n=1 Tax=Paractinoplanes maris TaxID=1734446 RepID=UPI002020EF5B|nr:hypothetical protein [Actinoplanes maris]